MLNPESRIKGTGDVCPFAVPGIDTPRHRGDLLILRKSFSGGPKGFEAINKSPPHNSLLNYFIGLLYVIKNLIGSLLSTIAFHMTAFYR